MFVALGGNGREEALRHCQIFAVADQAARIFLCQEAEVILADVAIVLLGVDENLLALFGVVQDAAHRHATRLIASGRRTIAIRHRHRLALQLDLVDKNIEQLRAVDLLLWEAYRCESRAISLASMST